MFSRRTAIVLLVALVLSVGLCRVAMERQALCAQTRHSFARRAPIPGASATNTYVCPAMVEHLAPPDIALIAFWWLATVALARSVRIDFDRRRISTEL